MFFSNAELSFLSSQTMGRLATVQPDGTLQVNPVGFSYNSKLDTFDIHGYRLAASRNFGNVATNGRAAFVIDDIPSIDPWRVAISRDPRPRRCHRFNRAETKGDRRRSNLCLSRTDHQLRNRHPRSRS